MSVRCKEMTERLKIIEDQEIEAIEAIDGGLEFELAACNQGLLNKVGRPGVLVKVDHPCVANGGYSITHRPLARQPQRERSLA